MHTTKGVSRTMNPGILETCLDEVPLLKRGKVRDVYDLGDKLLFVATDRISAFDVIMPTPIPDKGRILTAMSRWWFEHFRHLAPNHLVEDEEKAWPAQLSHRKTELLPRSMVVRKTNPLPVECVARGCLAGSGWKEYQTSGTVCGIPLPSGLRDSDEIPGGPIFTPATKAEVGHDENISFEQASEIVGKAQAEEIRRMTLEIFREAARLARERGVILFDTKFEFGFLDGQIVLIDELLTPDSSRYCLLEDYHPGKSVVNLDKQYLRDWLDSIQWNRTPPAPELPEPVVRHTRERYLEAYRRITGSALE
ncbi:MAG: Phosphoribosylaminoimidazole-succinocarboxamide synthase [Candidatus Hinthialibacteria bacterium OLB16]|nr:MAG: Phosphoribosylaminoimidazole-succinocarboxamide synthase [Candidatus Hinthialibacteria bacterium OLB16]